MNAEVTDLPSSAKHEPVGPIATTFFVIFALGGAYMSLMFWILGVGVPSSFHNTMALAFVAINFACVVFGWGALRRGKLFIGFVATAAAFPLCIGALFIAV
jgi:hypothetical protein